MGFSDPSISALTAPMLQIERKSSNLCRNHRTVAAFKKVAKCPRLPKTRFSKICGDHAENAKSEPNPVPSNNRYPAILTDYRRAEGELKADTASVAPSLCLKLMAEKRMFGSVRTSNGFFMTLMNKTPSDGGAKGIGFACRAAFCNRERESYTADVDKTGNKAEKTLAELGDVRFAHCDVGTASVANLMPRQHSTASIAGCSGQQCSIIHSDEFLDISEEDFDRSCQSI